ncbi:MAG: transporter [Caldilineaceae bacterium]|nr:transporter [Caldilineaceae bacterium]
MQSILTFLSEQPLILLFLVAAIGYLVGNLKIRGSSFGIAAVLFVGLLFGALDERLKLPEILYQGGLIIFVYCIGLSSGRAFFQSLRNGGLKANLLIITMLTIAALLAAAIQRLFALSAAQTAGLYAGSLTNTPALAAVLEMVQRVTPVPLQEQLLAEPVIGYSIAYPIGILGMILAIALTQRWWKPDYAAEAHQLRHFGAIGEELVTCTAQVTNPMVVGKRLSELLQQHPWRVILTRHKRDAVVTLAQGNSQLQLYDRVTVVGVAADVNAVAALLGQSIAEQLVLDRSVIDFRRIFVSNPAILGRRIDQLALPSKFNALITRVRRGDIELLATGSTVLEAGDRVRVVALRERMHEVSDFFGDSYRALSEIDILTFNVGIVLGLLLGQLPIPIPGSEPFRLGIAGGPLIVALGLGALERTGPLVWNIPYSANLTLRQFGIVLFLAVIGTRAGYTFAQTLFSSGGLLLLLSGALITCLTGLLTLWVGSRLLQIPMSMLIGMIAGLQTNPAILSYATMQTGNDLPNVGYVTVYPAAMLAKILLAQLLFSLLG